MSLEQLLIVAGSLGGVGALIAVIVNVAKAVGWVKDGQSPTVVTGANLLVLVVLFVVGIIKPDFDIAGADEIVGQVAAILSMVFGLVWQLLASRATHNAIKGVPFVGTSYSVEKARAEEFALEMSRRAEG